MKSLNLQHLETAERELRDAQSLPMNSDAQVRLKLDRVKVKARGLEEAASIALLHLNSDESGCVKE